MHMLDFFAHLIIGLTAKTTLYVATRLKNFEIFNKGIYRENDPRKILKQTLYQAVYRENDPLTAKTPFRVPTYLLYKINVGMTSTQCFASSPKLR